MTDTLVTPAGPSTAAAPLTLPAQRAPRIDTGHVADLIVQLLTALGEDTAREGLRGTPERVAAFWDAFLSPEDAATATCFAETHLSGQLVVVGGMSVWSLCEHHLLPMHLQVTAGYVPDGKVLGLSKFGRIGRRYASGLQVQERFTRQVTEEISGTLDTENVAVAVRGTHLCMSMRGVRMEDARTTTVQPCGRFGTDAVLSQQFLAIASGHWQAI